MLNINKVDVDALRQENKIIKINKNKLFLLMIIDTSLDFFPLIPPQKIIRNSSIAFLFVRILSILLDLLLLFQTTYVSQAVAC